MLITIYVVVQFLTNSLSWLYLKELSEKELNKLKDKIPKIRKKLIEDPLCKQGIKHPLMDD